MYYAKINWFNTVTEEDEVSFAFIPAKDWNAAMQEITSTFEWINSIEMTEISSESCGMVFVPENVVEAVIEENIIK